MTIGLSGPAFLFALFGVVMFVTVRRMLPDDRAERALEEPGSHGAATAYPSIGGQSSGASITAATASRSESVGVFDPRIRAWMIAGLVFGHAQAMTGQAIGFLVIDRLALPPTEALQPTGIVLMMGAGAALLVQWGLIPLLNLTPRWMMLIGLVIGAVGCALTGLATSLYGIATAYALAPASGSASRARRSPRGRASRSGPTRRDRSRARSPRSTARASCSARRSASGCTRRSIRCPI